MIALQQQMELWKETLTALSAPDSSLPPVTAIILDPFGGNLVHPASVDIVGPNCKFFVHVTQGASAFHGFGVPSEKSGISDFEEVIEKIWANEKLRNGREKQEILEAVSFENSKSNPSMILMFVFQVLDVKNGSDVLNGTIIRAPGVKEMYDYEREAANVPKPPGILSNLERVTALTLVTGMLPMMGEMVKLIKKVDGMLLSSSYVLEGPALEGFKQFTKPYPHGVQVAPHGWGKGHQIKNEDIRSFLDRNEKNTVLYISFG